MHSLDSWQALITACHCCPSLAAVKLLRVDADDNVMGASLNLPSLVRRQPPKHMHPAMFTRPFFPLRRCTQAWQKGAPRGGKAVGC